MNKKHILLLLIISFLVVAFMASATYLFVPNTVKSVFSNLFHKELDLQRSESLRAQGGSESGQSPVSLDSFIKANDVSESEEERIDSDMKKLTGLYKHLNRNYLWNIDYDKVYDAMATAMFDTLGDKYTYYVKEENTDDYKEEITGQYGGLGFYFSKTFLNYQNPDKEETMYCYISQVFPNSPASRGGLLSGDYITHINGQDVVSLEANECANLIKGEVGSEVELTIKRGESVFNAVFKRAVVIVPTVEYSMLEDSIGYMLILKFTQDTFNKVYTALKDLRTQGMKSLIIDLRDNPGGDVDIALEIANLFVEKEKLLTIKYKDEKNNVTFNATNGVLVPENIKIAVLINGGTASSSEVLSASLRDNGRATLIGTKSFGKGIMQVVVPYMDGYASVTTAGLIPPSGNEYHNEGLIPDIEVQGVIIKDEEREAFNALSKDKVATEFIEKHKDFTLENVNEFVRENSDKGISKEVLQILIRNEYYLHMNYDDRPKVDTYFDTQIKRAIEFLTSGK